MGKKKHNRKNKSENSIIYFEDSFIDSDEYEMYSQYDESENDSDYDDYDGHDSYANSDDDCHDDYAYGDDDKLPVDIAYIITCRILKHEKLLVVNGSIWRYVNKTGAFVQMQDDTAEMMIENYYTKNEYRLAKPSLASEIKTRICRHHDLQAKYEDFNTNLNLINCKNGVVSIGTESCILLEHSPKYHFTYCIHAKFLTEAAKTPDFDSYCNTSLGGEKKKRKLLLQMIGYGCSDMTNAKKAFFLKGEPDSGKSMILHFLEKLVGIEAVSNIPLHALGERFNKADLFSKKLNVCGEIKNVKLNDISYLKSFTGSDRISAEFKHGKIFSYTPTAKHFYAGNALPISEEDEATKAFINRICLLVFPYSIPKEMQDPDLDKKIWKERDAIFTAAVNTLPKLVEKNFKFSEPDDSLIYLKYYEENGNSLDMFVTDRCDFDPNGSTPVQEFRTAYSDYCERNALEIIGKTKMNSRLLEKHKVPRSRIHRKNSNIHHFVGIVLKKTVAE
ncbi:DNA primase family protein [Anaerotignum sp.]